MSSVFRPTTIADEAQIVDLSMRAFSVGRDVPFLNPTLLRWKYWDPRDDFPGSRSVAIDKDGRIVAHAGLWPVTIHAGGKTDRGVSMIDWASDPAVPGAGARLLQRLTKDFDFVYSIGGTEMTQSILPKFGFELVATALTFARPIRPWRQTLHHQNRNARLPLRLVRNLWWSRTPARAPLPGWTATEAPALDLSGLAALTGERDASFFQYLERCPAADFLGFHVNHRGREAGYFALSVAGQQARVAGVWLEDADPERWRIAFLLAQDAALRLTGACELVARTTAEAAATGAERAGLRLRARTPVYLFRRDGGNKLPLQFQIADNDSLFLGSGRAEFLT